MPSRFARLRDQFRSAKASRLSLQGSEMALEVQELPRQRPRRERRRPSLPPAYTFTGAPWSADDIRRRRESGAYPRLVESISTVPSQDSRPMPLPTPPVTPLTALPPPIAPMLEAPPPIFPGLASPPPYEFSRVDPAWNFQSAITRQSTVSGPAPNPRSAPPEYLVESLQNVSTRLARVTGESTPPFSTTWAQGRGRSHSQRLQNFLLHTLGTCYNLSLSTALTNEDSTYFALIAKFLKAHHDHEDLCTKAPISNAPVSNDHRLYAGILWTQPISDFGDHPVLWAHAYEILITHGTRQDDQTVKEAHAAKLARAAQMSRADEYVHRDERLVEIFAPAREMRWKKDFEATAGRLKASAELAGNMLLNEHLREMAREETDARTRW